MSSQRSLKDRVRMAIRISIAEDDVLVRDLLSDVLYELKALESRVRGGELYGTPECLKPEESVDDSSPDVIGDSSGLEQMDWRSERHAS